VSIFVEGGVVGRGDGASVSSVGSSCSPPPLSEDYSDPSVLRRDRVVHSPIPRRRIQSGVCTKP